MQDLSTFLSAHKTLSIPLIVIMLAIFIIEFLRLKRTKNKLNPTDAVQLINHQQAIVIDIRPNEVFRQGHIIDAQSISAAELKQNSKKLEKFKKNPLILVCQTGLESAKITALLQKHGYNTYSLSGGLRAWSNAQLPLIKE